MYKYSYLVTYLLTYERTFITRRGTVIGRRSLVGELSLPFTQPASDE